MNDFCGVLLRGSENDEAGHARVAEMMRAADRAVAHDPEHRIQIGAHGLSLGLATVPGAAVATPQAMVSDRDGLLCFGNLTLWNGHELASPTDHGTAVDIVGGWHRRKGEPSKISADGVWATYDIETRRLTLYRDHIGSRTLYYAETDLGVVFATRMQFLRGAGLGQMDVDMMSVAAWIVMRHPGQGRSYFRGVHELAPAHRLACHPAGVGEQKRYWSMKDAPDPGFTSDEDWIDHVRDKMIKAIRVRSAGEAQIGLRFSGGLDSSAIAGVLLDDPALDHLQAYAHVAATDVGDLADPDPPYMDDMASRHPRLVLHKLSSEHRSVLHGADRWFEQGMVPCNDYYDMATSTLSERALSDGVSFMFDGAGGDFALSAHGSAVLGDALCRLDLRMIRDELFRLSPSGARERARTLIGTVQSLVTPPSLRNRRRMHRGYHWTQCFPMKREWGEDPAFLGLLRSNAYEPYAWRKRSLAEDIRWEVESFSRVYGQLLPYSDFTDGQSILTRRTPFLDKDLICAVYRTPARCFVSPRSDRMLIRRAARDFIPEKAAGRADKAPFVPDFTQRLAREAKSIEVELPRLVVESGADAVIDLPALSAHLQTLNAQSDRASHDRSVNFVIRTYFAAKFLALLRQSSR